MATPLFRDDRVIWTTTSGGKTLEILGVVTAKRDDRYYLLHDSGGNWVDASALSMAMQYDAHAIRFRSYQRWWMAQEYRRGGERDE
jgi:hypothetical protein